LLVTLSLYRATPPKPPQEQAAAGTPRQSRFRRAFSFQNHFAEILPRFISKPMPNKEHKRIFSDRDALFYWLLA